MLATPLLRDGAAIGAIAIRRTKVRPFTPKQIALLKTFADQAAIAIENARLSQALEARNSDLTEALEQQTATAEILRVICQLADRHPAGLRDHRRERRAACRRRVGRGLPLRRRGAPLARRTAACRERRSSRRAARRLRGAGDHDAPATGRSVVERAVQSTSPTWQPTRGPCASGAREQCQVAGTRSGRIPLLREGGPLAPSRSIRTEVSRFRDQQIALLQTFADQAVIAIENVRLFTELEARNSDLTEALEQQTATSEILRVISSSPTDVQPVFDTIVRERAPTLRGRRQRRLRVRRRAASTARRHARRRSRRDRRPSGGRSRAPARSPRRVTARAILDRRVVHIADVGATRTTSRSDSRAASGFRSAARRADAARGPAHRRDHRRRARSPGRSPTTQIALLQTFADQAVIAIENVRLFKELEARNRDLTEALEQQTATSEILRVISRRRPTAAGVRHDRGERGPAVRAPSSARLTGLTAS